MSKLETNQVDPATGTTLTLGTSGDTIAVPSGVTIANSGTATGFGANTPAFEATITTEQNPSDNTYTLINFDSEIFDTASAYDTSNKRFTVPSGQAGKYFIYSYSTMGSNTNSDLAEAFLGIYKNGSRVKQAYADFSENKVRYSAISVSNTLDLSAGDYIQMYGLVNIVSGSAEIRTLESTFGGYKIIE
jgi:hypothetical protein